MSSLSDYTLYIGIVFFTKTMQSQYVLLCAICVYVSAQADFVEEPRCLSRFDYDYKMLTKVIDLEKELVKQKEMIADVLKIQSGKCHSIAHSIERVNQSFAF